VKQEDGAAALEAILSIILLLGVFLVLWWSTVLVYNQSRITTSAQLSAQSALTVFDRSTYRGGTVPARNVQALDRAEKIAIGIYNENSCGLLPNPLDGKAPASGCGSTSMPAKFGIRIDCANEGRNLPSVDVLKGKFTLGGGCLKKVENAQVMRATAEGETSSIDMGAGGDLTLNGQGAAYSYYPVEGGD
jgi:hypothetical protein